MDAEICVLLLFRAGMSINPTNTSRPTPMAHKSAHVCRSHRRDRFPLHSYSGATFPKRFPKSHHGTFKVAASKNLSQKPQSSSTDGSRGRSRHSVFLEPCFQNDFGFHTTVPSRLPLARTLNTNQNHGSRGRSLKARWYSRARLPKRFRVHTTVPWRLPLPKSFNTSQNHLRPMVAPQGAKSLS